MLKRFTVLLFTLLFSAAAFAQTGIIKGFVYDKGTGEPLIFTVVFLRGTSIGVQTDLNGYFSLRNIPVGEYTIVSTASGYDTARQQITVKANEDPASIKLFLRSRDRQLESVEVSARSKEKQTQTRVGITTVTAREMKQLPSAGGEPDIAQYLQVTPGVVFTGDQGGQLYIRGGSPTQTGILLDGVTIYNPFHSIGLFSVFETDAIRTVDIQTAGFNAEYGNRTSAILDIRTKDGNKKRLAGKVSASPIMGRVLLEGPLVKQKTEQGGSTTFLVSAKHSYLDQTSRSLYGGFGSPFNNGLPYSFTDVYGKVSFNADNGSKFNLFGFNFDDKARVNRINTDTGISAFHWNAVGGGTTFVISPGSSDALVSGKLAYSKYTIDQTGLISTVNSNGSTIDGFEGGIDFTYFLPGYSQLKYGVEVSGFHTSLDYTNSNNTRSTLDRRNTLASLFVDLRKNINQKFIIEPGLRIQYYSSLSSISPEPRVSFKYNISRSVRIKGAGGYYTQNIISTKNDQEIVNLFTGFLLSPDQSIQQTDGSTVNTNLVKAIHALGGIEVDIDRVELNLEGWSKRFSQLIELNRNKRTTTDPDFQAGKGLAYGVDLSAKYSYKRVYLWGVASYQMIQYTSLDTRGEAQTYPPPFDRRINLNFLGAYTAGKKREWEVSARMNVGSPFPFTQTQGVYSGIDPLANGIGTNVLQQNGPVSLLYASDINAGRLSWYHRLDLSAKRRVTFSKNVNLEITGSITNVYNRQNVFYVDRLSNQRAYQLPFFPSVNLTLNF